MAHQHPKLRINHPSPLIYCPSTNGTLTQAENQSSIPFDILPAPQWRWLAG